MDFSINGLSLTEVELTLPSHGAWVADVLTSDPDDSLVTGSSVTLLFGELVLLGTVLRGNASFGNNQLRIVGGKGGLGLPATRRGWNDATYAQIATRLLEDGGESMSATVTPAASPSFFAKPQFWSVRTEQVGLALSRVVDAVGLQWRVLSDGTIWIGAETWPDATVTGDLTLIKTMTEQGRDVFGVDGPSVLPGTTLEERQVSDVLYRLHRRGLDDQTLRMSVLYQD